MKRGFRVFALALAAALALLTVPASAGDDQKASYLALGDSYAFGFNPTISPTDSQNPANFPGYSDAVASALDLHLTNAACPGETSGSMISGTRPDNGCQDWRANFPLHTAYTGSQLAYAVKYLRHHHDTRLVTVQVGGNDLLILLNQCNGDTRCVLNGIAPVEAQMAANLEVIYSTIRSRAHYHGTIVAVPYFAFDYNNTDLAGIATSLDGVIASVALRHHARVADVFGAFKNATTLFGGVPCLAGLQIYNPSPPPLCDIHPSAAGHALIAQTVLAVRPATTIS